MTTQSEQRPVTLPVRTDTLATLLQSRRSVRKYQNRPVSPEFIEQILESARWAPSPHGRQPWRFAVLTAQKIKLRLADEMGSTWQQNLQMDGQNAAYDLGLDAGWMCAPLFCPEIVCEALDLDPRLIPQALITIGYAAADPQRRERLPLSSLIVRFD